MGHTQVSIAMTYLPTLQEVEHAESHEEQRLEEDPGYTELFFRAIARHVFDFFSHNGNVDQVVVYSSVCSTTWDRQGNFTVEYSKWTSGNALNTGVPPELGLLNYPRPKAVPEELPF